MGTAARHADDAGILGLVADDRDQVLLLEALDIVLHLSLADPQPLGVGSLRQMQQDLPNAVDLVNKPFTRVDLTEKVKRALAA